MEETVKVKDICRICIKNEEEFEPLFESTILNSNGVPVVDFINQITMLKITESDVLPKSICKTCIAALANTYYLVQMCINTNEKLHNTFEMVKNEENIYTEEAIIGLMDCKDENENNFDVNNPIDKGVLMQQDNNHDDNYKLYRTDTNDNLDIKNELENNLDPGINDQNEKHKHSTKRNVKITKYDCDICNKKFKNSSSLKRHMKSHDNITKRYYCDKCTKRFNKMASLTNHIKTHNKPSDKHFQCGTCGEKFFYAHILKRHSLKHLENKPFPCSICDKGCLTRSSLSSHMQVHSIRNIKRVHTCEICQKEYKFASFLSEHMKNHTGEKPYLCNLCGKGFRQSGALVYHLRSHSGTRLFKCELCDNTFMSSGTLKVHMRIHTNERPYVCDICGAAFRQSTDMKSHRRTHFGEKNVLCSICGKRFTSAGQLTIHIRSHTGEKPYVCSHCGKGFSTRSMVVKHIRIHTGEKPFTCTICNKSFNQRSTLKTHIATHKPPKIIEQQVVIKEINDGNCVLVDQQLGTHYQIETIESQELETTGVNFVVLPAAVPYNI